jgi:hypothetical protein
VFLKKFLEVKALMFDIQSPVKHEKRTFDKIFL